MRKRNTIEKERKKERKKLRKNWRKRIKKENRMRELGMQTE